MCRAVKKIAGACWWVFSGWRQGGETWRLIVMVFDVMVMVASVSVSVMAMAGDGVESGIYVRGPFVPGIVCGIVGDCGDLVDLVRSISFVAPRKEGCVGRCSAVQCHISSSRVTLVVFCLTFTNDERTQPGDCYGARYRPCPSSWRNNLGQVG